MSLQWSLLCLFGNTLNHFLLPSSTEPRNGFYVRNKPRAEGEDDGNEDDDIVPTAKDAATKAEVSELVEVQHGIVAHEIDHRMLSDIVDAWNAGHAGSNEETCQAAQDGCGIEEGNEDVTREEIAAHGIGSVVEDKISDSKGKHHDEADKEGALPPHPVHRQVPEASQLKVVDAHEEVVELHPQRIAQYEHPVA